MKKLENRIIEITGNQNFKISSEEYYFPVKRLLSDMLFDVIEKNDNNSKIKFLKLLEELCTNNEFYKLFDDDIPCLKSILDYMNDNNESKISTKDLVALIDKSLDELEITKDEIDIFFWLNERFKDFYNMNIENIENMK